MYKDYFSKQSSAYRTYRPTYPDALFAYLASISPSHNTAWDAATGNGQAALSLTPHFHRVIATDVSHKQLAHASHHPQISYWLSDASSAKFTTLEGEEREIADGSIDLVTVAQGYHWLEHSSFHVQVERVLRPGGVFAVWCYSLLTVSPEIDRLLGVFYNVTVGSYWPPERRLLEEGYRTIAFPFIELEAPSFMMGADWKLEALLGYLRTWSSVQLYIKERGEDPVEPFGRELASLWGEGKRAVRWPLQMRVGRKQAKSV